MHFNFFFLIFFFFVKKANLDTALFEDIIMENSDLYLSLGLIIYIYVKNIYLSMLSSFKYGFYQDRKIAIY